MGIFWAPIGCQDQGTVPPQHLGPSGEGGRAAADPRRPPPAAARGRGGRSDVERWRPRALRGRALAMAGGGRHSGFL